MADGFRINKAYAERYNTWRQKEELQKLKDRYDVEDAGDESSSSESEDEDAEALTEQLEKDWLRTLAALKSEDPRIFQDDVKFYHEDENDSENTGTGKSKKTKEKPMFLKDYQRKVILEKGGMISDDDSSDENEPSTSNKSKLGYHQEQEQLRKSIVAAAGSDSDVSDDEGLLKKREKSAEEKQREDVDFLEWLKGQKDTLDKGKEVGIELEPLKNYWQNKDLDEDEKFLRNYILNRQYIDTDDRGESVPTYDEIVDDEEDNLSEDEELLTKQDTFERKYNFRFEEPGGTEIKTYPREIEDSLRRKDTKRSDKRKQVEERKKKEKEKKKEELKQLKKLKRQEILDKIEKLKEITGNKSLGIDEKELEEDFDPSKYDQMMQQCFDEQYYQEGDGEEVKPEFEISDEEVENWDNWTGEEGNYERNENYDEGDWNEEPGVEDPDFIMDADYDPVADMERKKKKKEKKKKNKLAQALNTKKPVFDPNEKTFEEYFDEYYKLDYEDIIDDIPCRFKYRKVTPNTFGLTIDEILKSKDKELNAWVSVKKMSQYRTEEEEEHDIRAYRVKGKNLRKKQNVLTSLFEKEEKDEVSDKTEAAKESKKKKKRKRRKAKKPQIESGMDSQDSGIVSQVEIGKHKNKSGKKEKVESNDSDEREIKSDTEKISEHQVDTFQTKPHSSKHSNKRKAEENIEDAALHTSDEISIEENSKRKKKKSMAEENVDKIDLNNDTENDSHEHGNELPGIEMSKEEKRKKKKKNKKERNIDEKNLDDDAYHEGHVPSVEITAEKFEKTNSGQEMVNINKGGKMKKKKKNKNKEGQKLQMSEERLKAYGINPKRYKYMKKEELFQIKPRKNVKKSEKGTQHSDEIE